MNVSAEAWVATSSSSALRTERPYQGDGPAVIWRSRVRRSERSHPPRRFSRASKRRGMLCVGCTHEAPPLLAAASRCGGEYAACRLAMLTVVFALQFTSSASARPERRARRSEPRSVDQRRVRTPERGRARRRPAWPDRRGDLPGGTGLRGRVGRDRGGRLHRRRPILVGRRLAWLRGRGRWALPASEPSERHLRSGRHRLARRLPGDDAHRAASRSRLRSAVLVARSQDGRSFAAPVVVARAPRDVFFDKPWVACDDHPASPYYGRCYALWDELGLRFGARTRSSWRRRHVTTVDTDRSRSNHRQRRCGFGVIPLVRPDGSVVGRLPRHPAPVPPGDRSVRELGRCTFLGSSSTISGSADLRGNSRSAIRASPPQRSAQTA